MLDKDYGRLVKIWEDYGCQKQAMFFCMKPYKQNKARKFTMASELKLEEDRKQFKLIRKQGTQAVDTNIQIKICVCSG